MAAGLGLIAVAAHAPLFAYHAAARQQGGPDVPSTGYTWLLESPDALRPPAPGDATAVARTSPRDAPEARRPEPPTPTAPQLGQASPLDSV